MQDISKRVSVPFFLYQSYHLEHILPDFFQDSSVSYKSSFVNIVPVFPADNFVMFSFVKQSSNLPNAC
jgi:hypothetical protein